jgi:hypothetical protein
MVTPAAIPQKSHSVRAPFRLLAGLICLAGSVAVLGTAYVAWRRAKKRALALCVTPCRHLLFSDRHIVFGIRSALTAVGKCLDR